MGVYNLTTKTANIKCGAGSDFAADSRLRGIRSPHLRDPIVQVIDFLSGPSIQR